MTSTSDPGQVEPGPFSEDDLREQWNAQADEFNQWESLDSSEQLAWAQTRAIATITHTIPVAWCRSDDFRDAAQKRQSFSGWCEQHSDCDMALYDHPQAGATAPDADQAEGPSLAGVDELCAEFSFHYEDGDSLEILQEMIAAAITRWRTHGSVAQPAAKPVDVANLMRLVKGVDPLAPGDPEPDVDHILKLAEIIREVDGSHSFGATVLAEAILAHPGFSGCHDGPAALPAQGFQIGPQEYIPDLGPASEAQGEAEGSPIPEHKVKPSSFSIWNGPEAIIRDFLGRKLDNVLYCDPQTGEVISYVALDNKGRLRGDRHEILPCKMGDLLQQREFYPAPLMIEIEPATDDHA